MHHHAACNASHESIQHLDLVSVLKLASWLSFMEVFSLSACAVSAAFFSKAVYRFASRSACSPSQSSHVMQAALLLSSQGVQIEHCRCESRQARMLSTSSGHCHASHVHSKAIRGMLMRHVGNLQQLSRLSANCPAAVCCFSVTTAVC